MAKLPRLNRRRRDADEAETAVIHTTPDAPAQTTEVVSASAEPSTTAEAEAPASAPGFASRGRLRRRLRYVRRARELALRDLGGLVFDLHRFGRERTDLVDQKLAALAALDREMRELEGALDDRREVTVLREPGLASCPRCSALHASDARFCSMCGLPLGRGAELPLGATAPAPAPPPLPAGHQTAPAP